MDVFTKVQSFSDCPFLLFRSNDLYWTRSLLWNKCTDIASLLSALPCTYSETKKLICSIISIWWKRWMWKGPQRSESLLLIAITSPIKGNHFHRWRILCPISLCLGARCFRKLIHKSNVPKLFLPPMCDVFVSVFLLPHLSEAPLAKFVMILCRRNYLYQYAEIRT